MRDVAIQSVTDVAGVKVGAALTGLGAVLSWGAPVDILGVPVAVLLAALTGSLLGVIYGRPLERRRDAAGAVVVNTFLAAVFSAIAPHIPLFGWLASAPMGAVALVLAFAARWIIPALVESAPDLVRAGLARLGVKPAQPKGDAP